MNRKPGTKRNRLLRHKLFAKQKGKCFYCGTLMIEFAGHCQLPDDNMCTLEHMTNKLDREPGKPIGYVAACYKCNQDKGRERVIAEPIERRWEMSNAYPLTKLVSK